VNNQDRRARVPHAVPAGARRVHQHDAARFGSQAGRLEGDQRAFGQADQIEAAVPPGRVRAQGGHRRQHVQHTRLSGGLEATLRRKAVRRLRGDGEASHSGRRVDPGRRPARRPARAVVQHDHHGRTVLLGGGCRALQQGGEPVAVETLEPQHLRLRARGDASQKGQGEEKEGGDSQGAILV